MSALFRRSACIAAITVVMAFGLVACGESPNGPNGVSPERAETLGTALGDVVAAAFEVDLAMRDEEQLTFEETRDCPISGTVHGSGDGTLTSSIDGDTETVSVNMVAEFAAVECAGPTDDNRVLTFSTPSPLNSTISGETVVTNPGEPDEQVESTEFTVEWTGTFLWDLEGGFSGECATDMQMTIVVEPGSIGEVSVSGTTCGHPVGSASS